MERKIWAERESKEEKTEENVIQKREMSFLKR